jgi:hypothetical protein
MVAADCRHRVDHHEIWRFGYDSYPIQTVIGALAFYRDCTQITWMLLLCLGCDARDISLS